jgi:hypothetical protein
VFGFDFGVYLGFNLVETLLGFYAHKLIGESSQPIVFGIF